MSFWSFTTSHSRAAPMHVHESRNGNAHRAEIDEELESETEVA